MKILAVDDDAFILELLVMIAARAGFSDVTTAQSGEDALHILHHGGVIYDCLLLDINMPGMDGIELCNLVRAIPDYRKTPVIMLTAMADKDYIDRAFRAGATDYANKPFDIVDLSTRLRMAEEQVLARRDGVLPERAGDGTSPPRQGRHGFALSDEVLIEDIKHLIGFSALGNYLSQLSRTGLIGSQVLAIKIDGVESIYDRASSGEFIYALTEVAAVIADVMQVAGYMMAYAGNGVFVVVSNNLPLEPSIGLEGEIKQRLRAKSTQYDNGDPLEIEVSIGNPIRPNTNKTQGIRKTFDRAIARAESRVIKKHNPPKLANMRMITH